MKKFLICLMALLLMLNQATLAFTSAKADIDNFKAKRVFVYDTKGHPKAKGIRLTIPYPKSWVAAEGQHPNIVQKFETTIDEKYVVSTIIRIQRVPKIIESGYTTTEINSEQFRKIMVEKIGSKYLSSGATKIESENAFWVAYFLRQSYPTVNIAMFLLSYNVIYAGKLITITHGVSGDANDQKLKEIFDAYVPIFQFMTAGIIFPDKWSR